MTLTQIATELARLQVTFPIPRQAVKEARDAVLNLNDLTLALDLYLEAPSDLRLRLVTDCLARVKERAA